MKLQEKVMSGSVIFKIQPETWLHNLDLTLEIRLLQWATFEVVSTINSRLL